jgi:poly(3-hydroxybutyrate) depolymerase
MIRFVVAVLFLMTGCVTTPERVTEGPLAPGSGVAAFEGLPGKIMRVYYHQPTTYRPDSPILMVLHGVKRNADWYRDVWRELSDRYGVLVLAPEFDMARFPGGRGYGRGNMRAKGGDPLPQAEWAFNAVESLFDAARGWTGSKRGAYLMFGHSAGAQFVHRMVTFMPQLRLERAVAANAGWYTMADSMQKYPYGLDGAGLTVAALRTAFARNMTVLLGDADDDPQGRFLHNTPPAKRQGAHRFARGLAYFERATAAAVRIGADFAWTLEIAPGAAHSTKDVKDAAADILLRPR